MDLTVMDYDGYPVTGSHYRNVNLPAIYRTLSKEDQEQFGLYQGSGGIVVGFFSNQVSGSNNIPVSINTRENKLEETVRNICKVFSLTKEELTKACKVHSRKTLYNWIDGISAPRKTAMSRIFDLSLITQAWQQSGFSIDRESLHRPILDGLSVFDLLANGILDKERILFAGSRLKLSSVSQTTIKDPFA